jgi:Uncharacterised nucleotidyltransferase
LNKALAQRVVDSLRVSGNPEGGMACLQSFSKDDWVRTVDWLHLSGLALVFWHRLEERQSESVIPPEVRARLARNLADNQVRVREMGAEFDSINRRLEGAGVPFAVLKGFALIPEYFSDAALRSSTDYDYLLPKASFGLADQALRAAGYVPLVEPKKSYSLTYHQAADPSRLVSCLDDMYSTRLPREIELHSELWEGDRERIDMTLPDDLLTWRKLRSWQGLQFPALSDEDALIFHVLHLLKHLLGNWCRLSSLFEIAYFMHRQASDTAFWERLRRRTEGRGRLPEVIGVVFALAAGVFGVAIPPGLSVWTTQSLTPRMALWVDHYGIDLALQNFSGNKFCLLLHRELVQDLEGWKHVRRRRLFLLERPARVAEVPASTLSSHLRATCTQLGYVFGLLRFHLPATLGYLFELPRWKRMLRRIQRSKGRSRSSINPTITSKGVN